MRCGSRILTRLRALHLSAIKVSCLGHKLWNRAALYLLYLFMPVKSRLPRVCDCAVGLDIRADDLSMRIWISDRSEMVLLQEILLDGEYEFVQATRPDIILDLGANVGISVLWFRARYPGSRIIAVEPDPRTYRKLVRAFGGDSSVHCVAAAITERTEPVAFTSSPLSWGSHIATACDTATTTVSGLTLDELCDQYAPAQIDLIKMDIEGMEWQVLQGAVCLARTREVVGEMHDVSAPTDRDAFFESVARDSGLMRCPVQNRRLFRLMRPPADTT
jgi:FkbM family methyltransferase